MTHFCAKIGLGCSDQKMKFADIRVQGVVRPAEQDGTNRFPRFCDPDEISALKVRDPGILKFFEILKASQKMD